MVLIKKFFHVSTPYSHYQGDSPVLSFASFHGKEKVCSPWDPCMFATCFHWNCWIYTTEEFVFEDTAEEQVAEQGKGKRKK